MARDKVNKTSRTSFPRRSQSGQDLGSQIVAVNAPPLKAVDIMALGYWSPLTTGDPAGDLVFDDAGDTIAVFTPTP